MDKHILTDVDECCLQWSNGFDAWIRSKGYIPKCHLSEVHDFESWLDLSATKMTELMEEYSFTVINKTQEPLPCALEIIPRLFDLGWKFTAISACGVDETFRKDRLARLNEVFGFSWNDLHVVPLRHHKRDKLSLFSPSVWVEDHSGHALDGHNLGHKVFLIDYKYNNHYSHPEITRVKNWNEIYNHINGLK